MSLLSVRDLVKEFPVRGHAGTHAGVVHAVNGVSFDVAQGETLGIVGESGCGKSTTGRCVLRLIEPTSGAIEFQGRDLLALGREELRAARRNMQIVFQDPQSSLHPRLTVRRLLSEPLEVHRFDKTHIGARVDELLRLVQLRPDQLDRYPHEFSGGQRQRIGIARALALEPALLVLDEPVSALDVSIQAEIMRLLADLQGRLGLAFVLIAHDLAVVRQICARVAVMYLGKIVEIGSNDDIYERPRHPYTVALLSAAPVPDPNVERQRRRIVLTGDVPSPINLPSGCPFRTRCWKATEICAEEMPPLVDGVACHHPEAA